MITSGKKARGRGSSSLGIFSIEKGDLNGGFRSSSRSSFVYLSVSFLLEDDDLVDFAFEVRLLRPPAFREDPIDEN